jgi:hypothetical protein
MQNMVAYRKHYTNPISLNLHIFWYYTSTTLTNLATEFNTFSKNMIATWSSIRENTSTSPDHILSQPLWYNEKIKADKNNYITFTR